MNTSKENTVVTLDGTWDLANGDKMTISNYSIASFDLTWDGKTTHYVRAKTISGKLQQEDYRTWYIADGADHSGPYVNIDELGNGSYSFVICKVGSMSVEMLAMASIDLNDE